MRDIKEGGKEGRMTRKGGTLRKERRADVKKGRMSRKGGTLRKEGRKEGWQGREGH